MKVIAMYKRKPGLSVEQFRHHYETSQRADVDETVPLHDGLSPQLHPPPFGPRRSEGARGKGWDFDVITEMTFESPRDYERMLEQMKDPTIREEVEQDEIQFMDRSAAVFLIVDEECTPIP